MNLTDRLENLIGSLKLGFGRAGQEEELVQASEAEIYSRFFRTEIEPVPETDGHARLVVKFWGTHTKENLEDAFSRLAKELGAFDVRIRQALAYNDPTPRDGACATVELALLMPEQSAPEQLSQIRDSVENVFIGYRCKALNEMAHEDGYHLL
ncbi:MAG TPA: hypothetical protein PKI93_04530 [Alphaproteobacteria bacterium]|nr:hypothetical protein [Alphaproteobacteria bacterium]HNS44611.1 hypothetical protein [Alphaproteobacteria bacterium]